MMKKDMHTIREQLINFFKLINLPGDVTIELDESSTNTQYKIAVGENTFIGFYPEGSENIFTLSLIDTQKEISSGLEVNYIEAFTFYADTMLPYQFIIYQYPQTQTVYLLDEDSYHKGDIYYRNSCPCGHGMASHFKIDKAVFTSEVVPDISILLK